MQCTPLSRIQFATGDNALLGKVRALFKHQCFILAPIGNENPGLNLAAKVRSSLAARSTGWAIWATDVASKDANNEEVEWMVAIQTG